jgi:putative flippase GtrA
MTPSSQALRFLAAGVWNTAFGLAAYLTCDAAASALGLHYLTALVPAHLLAVTNAYAVHGWFVFPDAPRTVGGYLRYQLVYVGFLLANLVVLPALVTGVKLDHRVAQVGWMVVSPVLSFLAHRHFSFRTGSPPEAAP